MVALNSEGTPQLMNLKTILTEYVRHRQLVVVRRSQYELLCVGGDGGGVPPNTSMSVVLKSAVSYRTPRATRTSGMISASKWA